MPTPGSRLLRMDLFRPAPLNATEDELINLGYRRARASAREYGKTQVIHRCLEASNLTDI